MISYTKLKQSKSWVKISPQLKIRFVGQKLLTIKKQPVKFDAFIIDDGKSLYYVYVHSESGEIKLLGFESLKPSKKKNRVIVVEPKEKATTQEFTKILNIYAKLYPKLKNQSLIKESEESEDFLDRIANKVLKFMTSPKGQLITLILSTITPLVFLIIYYWKTFKIFATEKYAEYVEKQIAKDIFKGQTKEKPPLEEYTDLIDAVETLLKSDHLNGVLVYGRPGTGKSYIVRRTLYFNNTKYVIFKGATLSMRDIVHILYQYNSDYVIVFDDFDTVLKDEDVINILKAAADSYEKRIITFPQAQAVSSNDKQVWDIPERFVFTSKVILITNKRKNEIPKAILSRFYPVEVDFPSEKIVKLIEKLIDYVAKELSREEKLKILEFLKQLRKQCPSFEIDFRTFEAAVDLYKIKPNKWKETFKQIYC